MSNEIIGKSNDMSVFENPEFGRVRVIEVNGEPWFVGKDVAVILGYVDTNKAIAMHIDDEDKLNDKTASSLGQRGGWLINESGIYSLILSSKLESAKRFKHWVTSEVLPSIRKHGLYAADELLDNPEFAIAAFTALAEARNKARMLEATIQRDAPFTELGKSIGTNDDAISIGDFAKISCNSGINIGRNRLFAWMRNEGILMQNNIPYQRYVNDGYFVIRESTVYIGGSPQITKTTLITGKGQMFVMKKLREHYGLLDCDKLPAVVGVAV